MDRYRFGDVLLDESRGIVERNGEPLHLRPKAFDLLAFLVRNPERLHSKDALCEVVWPGLAVSDDSLAQLVKDIRRTLGDEGLIQTVPRRGYRFAADVTAAPEDGTVPPGIPQQPGRFRWPAAVVLVVLAAVGAFLLLRPDGVTVAVDPRLTIAALPFSTSGEGLGVWLGEGLAEDVASELAQFRDLAVMGRSSSFRYAASPDPLAELHRVLGVDYVLQGSLRREADTLHVNVQLVDAETGITQFARRYDRGITSAPELGSDIAGQIATALVSGARHAATARSQRRTTDSLEAYELTLQARRNYYTFERQSTIDGFALAEHAVELDPNYAPAWDVLSRLLMQFYLQPYDERQRDPAVLERAVVSAARSVELDPMYASGRAQHGWALRWTGREETALEEIRAAIELNPNDSSPRAMYADALSLAGYHRESIEAWNEATRIDPTVIPLNLALKARAHLLIGEAETALALSRSCIERAPRIILCHLWRAAAAQSLGFEEEAAIGARAVLELNPNFRVFDWLDFVDWRRMDDEETVGTLLIAAGIPQ